MVPPCSEPIPVLGARHDQINEGRGHESFRWDNRKNFTIPSDRSYEGLLVEAQATSAGAAFDHFLPVAKRSAPDFISNPLLLSLIIILYSKTRDIPDERAKLYEACSQLMFDRWDSYRDIRPDLPEKHSLFPLLSFLARKVHTDPQLGGRFSKRELEKAVEDFFVAGFRGEGNVRARSVAAAFVAHLVERAWILREVGQEEFEFAHRTFQDYFFARDLDDRFDLQDLFVETMPRLADWFVPTQLALQMKTHLKREQSDKAARLLVQELQNGPRGDAISARFCASTIEFLQPSHAEMRELTCAIVRCLSKDTQEEALQSFARVRSSLREPVFLGMGEGLAAVAQADEVGDAPMASLRVQEGQMSFESPGVVVRSLYGS